MEEIEPVETKKLPGIYIQDDFKWLQYIQNHDKNIFMNKLNFQRKSPEFSPNSPKQSSKTIDKQKQIYTCERIAEPVWLVKG